MGQRTLSAVPFEWGVFATEHFTTSYNVVLHRLECVRSALLESTWTGKGTHSCGIDRPLDLHFSPTPETLLEPHSPWFSAPHGLVIPRPRGLSLRPETPDILIMLTVSQYMYPRNLVLLDQG